MNQLDTIIIGAGIAGLTAAHYLNKADIKLLVLEQADKPGGRIRTDIHDGFLLDRGFQIFLTEYPEAQAILDYDALGLRAFGSGADVYMGNNWKYLRDTQEGVGAVIKSLFNSPATINDLFKLLKLKKELTQTKISDIYNRAEVPTTQYWEKRGFSDAFINSFWMPFYKGIFLDETLETSSRLFEFTFKMFSQGSAAIPEKGMQAIPQQIADSLPQQSIIYNQEVIRVEGQEITLASGQKYTAPHIILANATPILGLNKKALQWKHNSTFYYSTSKTIQSDKYIALDTRPEQVINSVVDLTAIQRNYGPPNKRLISVSSLRTTSEPEIRSNLQNIYGDDVRNWTFIKQYDIPKALPHRSIDYAPQVENRPGLYVCGDHCIEGSINGAMRSGRLLAEHILML